MYRCGVILQNGKSISKNCELKEQCETWLLELMENGYNLKKSIIMNKDNIKERWIEDFEDKT